MTAVDIGLFPDGCLRSFSVEGHAGTGEKGSDILCAALSALTRTALHVLSKEKRICLESRVDREGAATLKINSYGSETSDWLKGVTEYLLTGVFDLEAEYPEHLSIALQKTNSEEHHGT